MHSGNHHSHVQLSQENVCVESVGYLLEELRNPETLAAFKADVESANMFIGSLIFVQVCKVCALCSLN